MAAGVRAEPLNLGILAVSLAGSWFGLAGGTVWLVRRAGQSLGPALGLRVRPLDVPVGIVAGLVSGLVLVPVVSWPVEHLLRVDVSSEARRLTDVAPGAKALLLGLLVAVGTPLVEELYFRGLAQRAFVRRFGTGIGLVLSATFFAFAHLQPAQFPALLAFGAVLAVLAHRSGRLGPGIVAHATFNALTVVLLVRGR